MTASIAHDHLAVIFPRGATVTVVVTDHRRNRAGTSQTTVVVLGTQDGQITDVTPLAATLTGWPTTLAADVRRQLVAKLGGDPSSAARELVRDLSNTLHGRTDALHAQVLAR